jgi:hypothetical protein
MKDIISIEQIERDLSGQGIKAAIFRPGLPDPFVIKRLPTIFHNFCFRGAIVNFLIIFANPRCEKTVDARIDP